MGKGTASQGHGVVSVQEDHTAQIQTAKAELGSQQQVEEKEVQVGRSSGSAKGQGCW